MHEVVFGALAPYGVDDDARFTVDGPYVRLKPKAALTLGMAIHELATNAGKYGALSNAKGRIRVGWSVERSSEPVRLRFRWSESGGPPVEPPRRRGFGSVMIERGVAHELDGEVRLSYEASGVDCTMDIALAAAGG